MGSQVDQPVGILAQKAGSKLFINNSHAAEYFDGINHNTGRPV
jgi:hypothetical protein